MRDRTPLSPPIDANHQGKEQARVRVRASQVWEWVREWAGEVGDRLLVEVRSRVDAANERIWQFGMAQN